jgi:sugar phosphate isomerase/epimerase
MVDVIHSMRYGFTGGMYPPPDDVPFDERAAWQLQRSIELGATCLQITDMPESAGARQDLKGKAAEANIEVEGLVRALFVPLGTDPATRLDELEKQLARSKEAGLTVVRHGWGRLNLETTFYSPARDTARQLEHIANCLSTAAPLAEAAGVPIAVENHGDFPAEDLVAMLRSVGSDWIGCAVDTANSFTVFRDPNAEVPVLAPLAFTTHIKDMRMIKNPLGWAIPLIPVGCHLGEGHVDVPKAIETLAQLSPKAEGLHLIVEAGWEPEGCPEETIPHLELRRSILEHGVAWLRDFVTHH